MLWAAKKVLSNLALWGRGSGKVEVHCWRAPACFASNMLSEVCKYPSTRYLPKELFSLPSIEAESLEPWKPHNTASRIDAGSNTDSSLTLAIFTACVDYVIQIYSTHLPTCLPHQDPYERLSAAEAAQHAWLKMDRQRFLQPRAPDKRVYYRVVGSRRPFGKFQEPDF